MSNDFFRIERGLELDEKTQLLQGSGVPGTSGDTSLAPVGSEYSDNATGNFFMKVAAGVGTNKWKQLATVDYVNYTTSATISWREPGVVRDNASTSLPVGVAGNPILVDGVSITDTKRVLFSAIVGGGGPNVYEYDQATGLFVEDVNNETVGDTLYIAEGTDGGKRFTYTASGWVQSDATTVDELNYIRQFIGKNAAGAENPGYSSVNFITQGASLETTIGQLDAEIGANVTSNTIISSSNKVNGNIQALANFVEGDSKVTNVTNVTTSTVIDGVVSIMTKWLVRVVQVGTPANVYSVEVFATHNGIAPDNTKYAALKLGANITGLTINVTLTGGNTLNLVIASTAAVDVVAKRVAAV